MATLSKPLLETDLLFKALTSVKGRRGERVGEV